MHVADNLSEADVALTTKAHYRRRAGALLAAEEQGVPVYVLRRNTPGQIVGFLEQMSGEAETTTEPTGITARWRRRRACSASSPGEASVIELRPQSSFVRRVQHRIAEQAQLRSHSVGQGPRRRVTIRRT